MDLTFVICGKSKDSFSLNKEDLVTVLTSNLTNTRKKIISETVKSCYRTLHPVSPKQTVYLADNFKGYRLLNELRKIVPGVLPSEQEEISARNDYKESFGACLSPTRTSLGWQVDIGRVLDVLKFKYPFITSEMVVRLTGDGRVLGGRHSSFVAVNVLNDELLEHGVPHQSPKQCFPVALFYEGDSRDNLEQNLTKPENKINNFHTTSAAKSQYDVYFAADEMFAQACLDSSGKLNPKSATDWNIYATNDIQQKDEVADSGLRTVLPPLFTRTHSDSIFPEIDLKKLVFCVLHGGARVVEKLLNVELENILCKSNKTSERNSLSTEDLVRNLENNIRARGVKGGNFKIELNDKAKQAEAIKLNKDDAFSIIFPTIPGQNEHPHVLHNVLSSESQIPLKFLQSVIDHLKLPQSLSDLEYVSLMWSSFYSMFSILKSEPNMPDDLATASEDSVASYTNATEPEARPSGANSTSHQWGYTDDQKKQYTFHAERFYQMYKQRYNFKELTPYMMKFIDYAPYFMDNLPVPLNRFQTVWDSTKI